MCVFGSQAALSAEHDQAQALKMLRMLRLSRDGAKAMIAFTSDVTSDIIKVSLLWALAMAGLQEAITQISLVAFAPQKPH